MTKRKQTKKGRWIDRQHGIDSATLVMSALAGFIVWRLTGDPVRAAGAGLVMLALIVWREVCRDFLNAVVIIVRDLIDMAIEFRHGAVAMYAESQRTQRERDKLRAKILHEREKQHSIAAKLEAQMAFLLFKLEQKLVSKKDNDDDDGSDDFFDIEYTVKD